MSQEQLHQMELPPPVEIPKSIDLFTGSPEGGVGYDFNDAVIAAQVGMGSEFYLTPSSFAVFMPSDWASKPAGEALADFDRGYEKVVLKKKGYSEGEIALVMAEEEGASQAEIEEIGQQYPEWVEDEAEQQPFDREVADIEANYDDDAPRPTESIQETADSLPRVGNESEMSGETTDAKVEAAIARELNAFDEQFGNGSDTQLPRAEFEEFLRGHPDLTTEESDGRARLTEVSSQPTADATPYDPHAGESLPDNSTAEFEREANLSAFEDLLAEHPELAASERARLEAAFTSDLDSYIEQKYPDSMRAA